MRQAVVVGCALLAASCSGYVNRLEPVHRHFYADAPEQAAATLRGFLDPPPGQEDEVPDGSDPALLRLELASALQAAGRYGEAALLLQESDDALEVLDYTHQEAAEVADYLFAGEGAEWRPTPPERLLVNTQGMINCLADRENPNGVNEAAVEAERGAALVGVSEYEQFGNPFFNALAGFSLEADGRPGEAADFWRLVDEGSPLRASAARRPALPPRAPLAEPVAGAPAEPEAYGTLLVIVQMGKAPVRAEQRIGFPLNGQVYQLRMPVLARRSDAWHAASVQVDGQDCGPTAKAFDFGAHLEQRYEDDRPGLLGAAALQFIVRAAAAKALGDEAGKDDPDSDIGYWTEFFANLLFAELQPPDTRCWTLVPQSFHALRLELPVGEHEVAVQLSGRHGSQQVPLGPVAVSRRRPAVVNVVAERYRGWDDSEDRGVHVPKAPSEQEVTQWEGFGDVQQLIVAALAEQAEEGGAQGKAASSAAADGKPAGKGKKAKGKGKARQQDEPATQPRRQAPGDA